MNTPLRCPQLDASYKFNAVGEAHLAMLSHWRSMPHVRRWWGNPSDESEEEQLSDPNIAMWVVEFEGRPFAFVQDYDVHAWGPHPFAHLPHPSRGIDLYIGEPEMLRRGHGGAILRQHVSHLFTQGAHAVGADPHPKNVAAHRAYEKAGFRVVSGRVTTPWGPAILMECRRSPGE